jgi:putative oxidoreductase
MIKKIFAPGNDSAMTSFALLVLRLWIGLTMMLHHGLDKLTHFDKYSQHFVNFMGLGPNGSLCLSIFAEFFASALLVLGLLTRFGAVVLTINMSVAFVMVHKMALSGPMPGELAFIYLAVYVTLLLAGAGKFSLDKILFGKGK